MPDTHNKLDTYSELQAANALNGLRGFDPIDDAGSVTGVYRGILVLETATFVAAGTTTANDGTIPDGTIVPGGTYVPGPFTGVQISAGVVLAYLL